MDNIKISVNQLANFSKGSEAKKKQIIRQQKKPLTIIVARYQLAKARIRKVFASKGDLRYVIEALTELKDRKPDTAWKKNDKSVSIEALNRFIKIKLPEFLKDLPYEVLKKPINKSIRINGVDIIVSPDLIIRVTLDGKNYLGALKLHVSKGNVFEPRQSRKISTILYHYLTKHVASNGDIVHKDFCMALDIFDGRIITAPEDMTNALRRFEDLCDELRALWNVA